MVDPGQLKADLLDVLACVEQLNTVLSEERDAVAARQIDELEQITQQKSALLAHLEAAQGAIGARSLSAQIAETPTAARDELDTLHKKLTAALEECRYKNSVNGKVIGRSQQSTAALIRTIAGSEGGSTYDRNGRSQPDAEGTDIARV